MVVYNFKQIQVVPAANDLIDTVLSKTQRKTPTQIHKGFKIIRIRGFYMRKVKFAQQSFHDKLNQILEDFPRVEELHPFYADLINVLYDKDHYKLALGQLAHAKGLIDGIARDYVRLLKYGDTLYRCKQLKRAALGRMCTLVKRHVSSLAYLEEVRQHMARLPGIDPTVRTLLISGFPNVGKSSFMNKVTRAEVDVQPYAFTTKSLFVGHMDYRYLRWQVIDTPGILDHSLEERNTIEMQSITALAHLRAAVLFFIDPSEACGYSLEKQISLFQSLAPLFANKPLVIVTNKVDLGWEKTITKEQKQKLESLVQSEDNPNIDEDGIKRADKMLRMSNSDEIGISEVRNTACDLLLAHRVEQKVRSQRAQNSLNRLHLATPAPRDNKARLPNIPQSVLAARAANAQENLMDDEDTPRKTEKDLEAENGGPGVYAMDWRKLYKLREERWAYDVIPEIVDGKNIVDYVDEDIEEKLRRLEEEEEAREAIMDEDLEALSDELDEEEREQLQAIREKKKLIKMNTIREKTKNRSTRTATQLGKRGRADTEFEEHLEAIGMDPEDAEQVVSNVKARHVFKPREVSVRPAKRAKVDFGDPEDESLMLQRQGFGDVKQKITAEKVKKRHQRKYSQDGRIGEADRHVFDWKPKHLYSGKRGIGKTDRR